MSGLGADPARAPRLALSPELENVRTAREFVAGVCQQLGVDDDVRDTAVLLTSEVVTNAFLHGRSEARVSMDVRPERVVVMVADDNSRHPQRVTADDEALDGRGLAIIELVASRWGVRDDDYGKTVWFALDRT